MNNIILVDSSYTSFYRFFATLRWISMAEKDLWKMYKDQPKYNWLKNKIFKEKYKKMYLQSIENLVKKKVFKKSVIIFCLDTPKDKLWRTKIYPECKGGRADLSKKRDFKPTFKYTYRKLIPKLVKKNENIFMMRKNKMEADDIIAIITKYLSNKKKKIPIYLISGDEDFKQLGNEHVNFIDYRTKKIKVLTKKEAKENLLNKIIKGDCSDNIPSIFPKGFSSKIKKDLVSDNNKLKKYLKSKPSIMKQFILNQKLIDFNMIPKKYIKKIINDFSIIEKNNF